jgi:hypothetical protein
MKAFDAVDGITGRGAGGGKAPNMQVTSPILLLLLLLLIHPPKKYTQYSAIKRCV